MNEWNVNVVGVGNIGTVHESTEELARCAALCKYGEEGRRPLTGALPLPHIYENDEFSVSKRRMTRTDTERLDWAFAHSSANYDHDWKTGEHWITFWHEGEHRVASGQSYRECVDNALDGNYTRID